MLSIRLYWPEHSRFVLLTFTRYFSTELLFQIFVYVILNRLARQLAVKFVWIDRSNPVFIESFTWHEAYLF